MGSYIAKRLLLVPLILWVIYTLTFLMAVAAPGNPFAGQGDRAMSPEVERAVRARYRADDNWAFYWEYLRGLLGGHRQGGGGPWIDLGPSWQYRDWTCNQVVSASLPVSVTLGMAALLMAVLLGVPVGVASAVRRGGWLDVTALAIALVGVSLPTFVTGATLLIVFGVKLGWFPVGGWGRLSQLWLPALTLSLPFMAYIARLMRLGMLDVLDSDFIRTARAKGLRERVVVWRHAVKNAFLPVLSFLGPAGASALTGSFVVERIFNVPGLGQHFVASVINRDRAMILATVLVYSSVIVLFNLLVDVAYALVDPRIEVDR